VVRDSSERNSCAGGLSGLRASAEDIGSEQLHSSLTREQQVHHGKCERRWAAEYIRRNSLQPWEAVQKTGGGREQSSL
jgi:hypothetical protein